MTWEELLALAAKAGENAYVPYSKFPVGAALEGADGTVFTGCNVENAAYGSTICAERTAAVKAVSQGAPGLPPPGHLGPEPGLLLPLRRLPAVPVRVQPPAGDLLHQSGRGLGGAEPVGIPALRVPVLRGRNKGRKL